MRLATPVAPSARSLGLAGHASLAPDTLRALSDVRAVPRSTGGRRLARCSGLCGDLGWRGRGLSNDLRRTTPLLMVPKLVAMTTPMHPLLIAHQPRPQPTISALCRPACVVCFIRNARRGSKSDLFLVEIQTIRYGNGPRRSIPLRAHAVADETRPNQHHNGSSTPRWASVTSITVRCLPFVRIATVLHFSNVLDPAGFFRGGGRFVVTDTAVVAHKHTLPILVGVPHMSRESRGRWHEQ